MMSVFSQLMYDKTDGGHVLRKFNSFNLAWWHTYKYTSIQIWRAFAQCWLAPWFHDLYPSAQFHKEPKCFAMIVQHFLYLLKAYPSFKDQLTELRLSADITGTHATALADLEFLLEYAIPVVCFVQKCVQI